jgi:hypothetical protein
MSLIWLFLKFIIELMLFLELKISDLNLYETMKIFLDKSIIGLGGV